MLQDTPPFPAGTAANISAAGTEPITAPRAVQNTLATALRCDHPHFQHGTDLYLHSLWELLELQGSGRDFGSDPSALTHDPNQLHYNSHDTHRLSRWKKKCYQHNPNGKGLGFFPQTISDAGTQELLIHLFV